jgi:hypothetical protein
MGKAELRVRGGHEESLQGERGAMDTYPRYFGRVVILVAPETEVVPPARS